MKYSIFFSFCALGVVVRGGYMRRNNHKQERKLEDAAPQMVGPAIRGAFVEGGSGLDPAQRPAVSGATLAGAPEIVFNATQNATDANGDGIITNGGFGGYGLNGGGPEGTGANNGGAGGNGWATGDRWDGQAFGTWDGEGNDGTTNGWTTEEGGRQNTGFWGYLTYREEKKLEAEEDPFTANLMPVPESVESELFEGRSSGGGW